ncbi:hypothetical protein SARC_12762 [Sphaeroforma arctica JP610]|uniref:RING-type domain-containing protein n=1 Tax=Sphaeroforma arctica JP610 TaxID=667725 RepID=A0A0L0FD68_9EUKA|nr:hypothetical protein SARC_12762 [Sphaeroforma arctica JP610]KNC74697.1 hypothetical protein SARC_12762 [Sphaeroforma arctica JP610]|eukprot:XP_014148599.1 hypothetical protein SARC_12762 [Sphaeroforma arctica JP610]
MSRACWKATEDALFHFDVDLAVNLYLSVHAEMPSDNPGNEFMDMSTRVWLYRWHQPDHGGLALTASEVHHLHLQLRKACVAGLVYRVQWYLLFWGVPVDPPSGVPNPMGLSLMDYTIIGLGSEEMLSLSVRSTGSENMSDEQDGFAWARWDFKTPEGMWRKMFDKSTGMSKYQASDLRRNKHSALYYLQEILRPETRKWERCQIMHILLRLKGELSVRLDQIIGHGRSEMLGWLISQGLIDLNRNVLVVAGGPKIVVGHDKNTSAQPADDSAHDNSMCDSKESTEGNGSQSNEIGVSANVGERPKREADADEGEINRAKRTKVASEVPDKNQDNKSQAGDTVDGGEGLRNGNIGEGSEMTESVVNISPPENTRAYDAECCVCLHVPRQWIVLVCKHEVCMGCAHQLLMAPTEDSADDADETSRNKMITCPMCRATNPAPAPAVKYLDDPLENMLLLLSYTAPVLDEKIKDIADSAAVGAAQAEQPVVTLHELLVAFCANIGAVRPLALLLRHPLSYDAGLRETPCLLFKDESPLHMAARAGHHAVVWFILCSGEYPGIVRLCLTMDSLSSEGFHPIHLAALGDHSGVVQIFLDMGRIGLKDLLDRTYEDLVNKNREKYPKMAEMIDHNDAYSFLEELLPAMIRSESPMEKITARAKFEYMPACPEELFDLIVTHDRVDVLEWCTEKRDRCDRKISFDCIANHSKAEKGSKVGKYLLLQRAKRELPDVIRSDALRELARGYVRWQSFKEECEEWDDYYKSVELSLPEAEVKRYSLREVWVRVLTYAVKAKQDGDLETHEQGQLELVEWVLDRLDADQDIQVVYSAWEYALLHYLPCTDPLKHKLRSANFDFNSTRGGALGSYNDRLFTVYMYQPWDSTRRDKAAVGSLEMLRVHMLETDAKLRDITPLETGLVALELLQSSPIEADTTNLNSLHLQMARILLYKIIGFYVEQLSTERPVMSRVTRPMPRLSMNLVDGLIRVRHLEALTTLALQKGVNIQSRVLNRQSRISKQSSSFFCSVETFQQKLEDIKMLQRNMYDVVDQLSLCDASTLDSRIAEVLKKHEGIVLFSRDGNPFPAPDIPVSKNTPGEGPA